MEDYIEHQIMDLTLFYLVEKEIIHTKMSKTKMAEDKMWSIEIIIAFQGGSTHAQQEYAIYFIYIYHVPIHYAQ